MGDLRMDGWTDRGFFEEHHWRARVHCERRFKISLYMYRACFVSDQYLEWKTMVSGVLACIAYVHARSVICFMLRSDI